MCYLNLYKIVSYCIFLIRTVKTKFLFNFCLLFSIDISKIDFSFLEENLTSDNLTAAWNHYYRDFFKLLEDFFWPITRASNEYWYLVINQNRIAYWHLIYIFIFFIWILLMFIWKKIKYKIYYNLINYYFRHYFKTHWYYFIVNPRKFLHIGLYLKRKESITEYTVLQEKFLSQFDSKEARDIYDRMAQYINLLTKRANDNTPENYFDAEQAIILEELVYATTMLEDLKVFYRTQGTMSAYWMEKYHFKEKYDAYVELSKVHRMMSSNIDEKCNKIKPDFIKFLNHLKGLINNKDKIALKIEYLFYEKHGIPLFDVLDVENADFFVCSDFWDIISSLRLQKLDNFNIRKLLTLFLVFYNDAKIVENWYVDNQELGLFLSYYKLGIDKIIRSELNSFSRTRTYRFKAGYKRSIVLLQRKENVLNYIKNLYIINFLNKKAFFTVKFLISQVRKFYFIYKNWLHKKGTFQYRIFKFLRKNLKLLTKTFKSSFSNIEVFVNRFKFKNFDQLLKWWDSYL